MKKLLLLLFAVVFALISCDTFWFNQFIIQNETSHTIKIIGFYHQSTSPTVRSITKPDTFIIATKGEYEVLKRTGYRSESQTIFKDFSIDSIFIIFDDKKKIVQKCPDNKILDYDITYCPVERNMVKINNFLSEPMSKRQGSKKGVKYTYVFTEADYQRAK